MWEGREKAASLRRKQGTRVKGSAEDQAACPTPSLACRRETESMQRRAVLGTNQQIAGEAAVRTDGEVSMKLFVVLNMRRRNTAAFVYQ